MKVFISHSWSDKSLATQVCERLQNDGHEVWYDIHQLIPGDSIQATIDTHIDRCEVVVLIWSANALASDGVNAEINTAKRLHKRIIPLTADTTALAQHPELKGLLGIPFDETTTGLLLLQRALLMLMTDDSYRQTPWFKEAFDNVVDLGGFLNYVNTYRLKGNKNDDGYKEEWASRLEALTRKNDLIRRHLISDSKSKMETLQKIMKELEEGHAPLAKLLEWKQWCQANRSFQPDLLQKLEHFIDSDIRRLE